MKRLAFAHQENVKLARRAPVLLEDVLRANLLWHSLSQVDKEPLILVSRRVSALTIAHVVEISRWPHLHLMSLHKFNQVLCEPPYNTYTRAFIFAKDHFLRRKMMPEISNRLKTSVLVDATDTPTDWHAINYRLRTASNFPKKALRRLRLLMMFKFSSPEKVKKEARNYFDPCHAISWARYCLEKNIDTLCPPWNKLPGLFHSLIQNHRSARPSDVFSEKISQDNLESYILYQISTSQKWTNELLELIERSLSSGVCIVRMINIQCVFATYASADNVHSLSLILHGDWMRQASRLICLRADYMTVIERLLTTGVRWADLLPPLYSLGCVDALAFAYSLGEASVSDLKQFGVYEKVRALQPASNTNNALSAAIENGGLLYLCNVDKHNLIFVSKSLRCRLLAHFEQVSKWPGLYKLSVARLNELIGRVGMYDDFSRGVIFASDYLLRKRIGAWVVDCIDIVTLVDHTETYDDGILMAGQLAGYGLPNPQFMALCVRLTLKFAQYDNLHVIFQRHMECRIPIPRPLITECASWCLLGGFDPAAEPWCLIGAEFSREIDILRAIPWGKLLENVTVNYDNYIHHSICSGEIEDLVEIIKVPVAYGNLNVLRCQIHRVVMKYGTVSDIKRIYAHTNKRISRKVIAFICSKVNCDDVVLWMLKHPRLCNSDIVIRSLCAVSNTRLLTVAFLQNLCTVKDIMRYGWCYANRVKKLAYTLQAPVGLIIN